MGKDAALSLHKLETAVLKRKYLYAAACLVVILLPVMLTLLLVRLQFNAGLSQSIPTYFGTYNDAFYYWRQVYTSYGVGFNGGYYTLFEGAAPANFSHFYVHGPTFPLLYGALAKVIGWNFYSGPYINLLVVTLALIVFVYALRPSYMQLALLGVMLTVFWPLLLYLPATMQESLHSAFAVVLALVFFYLLTRYEDLSTRRKYAFIAVLMIVALVRVIWSFLFIPFFLLTIKRTTVFNVLWALVQAAVCIGVLFALNAYLMVPYPFNYAGDLIAEFRVSLERGISLFLNHLRLNIDNFDIGFTLAIVQRYMILILLLLFGASALLKLDRARQFVRFVPRLEWREIVFHSFNLGIPLMFNFTIYDFFEWHDYRNLAPHFLLSLLVFLAYRRYTWMIVVVIVHLLLLPTFLQTYREFWGPGFTFDHQRIDSFKEATQAVIVYDPEASNAWCNTLLMRMTDWGELKAVFPPELMALHPGIGISFFFEFYNLSLPLKSKYLLLDEATRNTFPTVNTELLGTTSIGNIYLNLDAAC
jgi:hypothetical protein